MWHQRLRCSVELLMRKGLICLGRKPTWYKIFLSFQVDINSILGVLMLRFYSSLGFSQERVACVFFDDNCCHIASYRVFFRSIWIIVNKIWLAPKDVQTQVLQLHIWSYDCFLKVMWNVTKWSLWGSYNFRKLPHLTKWPPALYLSVCDSSCITCIFHMELLGFHESSVFHKPYLVRL